MHDPELVTSIKNQSVADDQGQMHVALFASLASALTSFSLLLMAWFHCIRDYYFPSGDEFALLVNSTKFFAPSPSSWLTKGFIEYFVPYSDRTQPYTRFLRPVANATYYFNSIVFGRHWGSYLLANYAIQSGIVGMVVYFSLKHLRLSLRASLLASILYFAYPAFGWQQIIYPSFAFDLLASLLVLLALDQILSKRIALAWLLLLMAVFTKEIAVFAPLVATILVYMQSRTRGLGRVLSGAAFLAIDLLWLLARFLAYGRGKSQHTSGTAVLLSPTTIGAGILRWPVGIVLLHRDLHSMTRVSLCVIIMNLLFWVLVVVCAARRIRSVMKSPKTDSTSRFTATYFSSSQALQSIILFAAGALGVPIILNLPVRFGAVFYPLFILIMAALLSKASLPIIIRGFALSIVLTPAVLNAWQAIKNYGPYLVSMRNSWAMSSNYVRMLGESKSTTMFILDDMSGGYSSASEIMRFSGFKGQIVRIDDVPNGRGDTETDCDVTRAISQERFSGNKVTITSWVEPPCAGHTFLGSLELLSDMSAMSVTRRLKEVTITYTVFAPPNLHTLLIPGPMTVEITGTPVNSMLLVPDVKLHTYHTLKLR